MRKLKSFALCGGDAQRIESNAMTFLDAWAHWDDEGRPIVTEQPEDMIEGLRDKTALYLYDACPGRLPGPVGACMIVASSPNKGNYGRFKKDGCDSFSLPTLPLEELQAVWQTVRAPDLKLTEQELKKRYAQFGGVLRSVLTHNLQTVTAEWKLARDTREDVIKQQWHTQTMRGRWRVEREYNFLLTVHEHLFIFRRPGLREDLARLRDSMKWSS